MTTHTLIGKRPIRRALISVYDKSGLVPFAKGLHEAGVTIVSTGCPSLSFICSTTMKLPSVITT